MSEVNWKGLCKDFFCLLDAIEQANTEDDQERLHALVIGRFQMAETHGLQVENLGIQAAGIQ